ncbi:hypothetical protein BV20DRAFT_937295, partial [Pilatotrama ljubarskyi]
KMVSSGSSPIAVPRRKSIHPPPCSPSRDQNSPELVFNFEFSVSPDRPGLAIPRYLQNQGATARLFPLHQKTAAYLPLSALGSHHSTTTHPYAHEPFLYTVPKALLRDTQYTNRSARANSITDTVSTRTSDYDAESALGGRVSSEPSIPKLPAVPSSSLLADHAVDSSRSAENSPLTTAFRRPLASVSSSSGSWSNQGSFCPSSLYRSPSPSPPRASTPHIQQYTRSRLRPPPASRSKALQRTAAAAPVVSLNVAQAERPCLGNRGRSPYPGTAKPRTRRSSTVGTGQTLEKIREPSRRMSTVIGRGAGRVVSLGENRLGSNMSLVSDEDIERSLEKDHAEVAVYPRERSWSPQPGDERGQRRSEKEGDDAEPERGRSRSRVPVRGTAVPRTRTLPGWQWTDAH